MSQLLAAWMGQPLGFSNNSKETSTPVGAHDYRLCLGVGVQPENADFFLKLEKDGFPQRFVWMPTGDPGMPRERPDPIEPLAVRLPDFSAEGADFFELELPATARDAVWRHHWQVMTGVAGVDPLDKHIALTRLKVAAAIAALHGDSAVTDQAWELAGHLIAVSNRQRAGLRQAVADRRRRENTARAHDQADREAIVAVRLAEKTQERVRQAVVRKLGQVGVATRRELQRACSSALQRDFLAVFDWMLDQGLLVAEGGEGNAVRYRLNA